MQKDSNQIDLVGGSDFQLKLLAAVQQAIIATDPSGAVTYWNGAAERLYLWTAKEAIGRDIMDLLLMEPLTALAEQIMSQVREGDIWTGDFTVRRKDGKVLPISVTNSPIFGDGGAIIGIVGVSQDISERKRSEMELIESE
ncbi:MAG: PAS domain S-box protein, partial [Pyrinomonadaceae bacterium]